MLLLDKVAEDGATTLILEVADGTVMNPKVKDTGRQWRNILVFDP